MADNIVLSNIYFNSQKKPIILNNYLDPDYNFFNDSQVIKNTSPIYYNPNSKIIDKGMEDNSFSMLHINIRSIQKNFESLKQFFHKIDIRFQVTCLSETWCNDVSIENNFNCQLPNYKVIHQVRALNKEGGGLCIYIKNSILFKRKPQLSSTTNDYESLCVEIINKTLRNTVIHALYRPPSGSIKAFENHIKKYDKNKNIKNFFNTIFQNSYIPLINKPTQVTRESATSLDQIITNDFVNIKIRTSIFKSDISDHFPIFILSQKCIDYNVLSDRKKLITTRNTNITKKHVYLTGDYNINLLNHSSNVNVQYFLNTLTQHDIIPKISKSTRITNTSSTLLDNIFTNNIHNCLLESGIIKTDITDHFPIFLITNNITDNYSALKSTIQMRQINENSLLHFRNRLIGTLYHNNHKRHSPIDSYHQSTLPSTIEEISLNSDLDKLRAKYPKNISLAFLNINSIRNKFSDIVTYINKTVDILILGETKDSLTDCINNSILDGTFPSFLKIADVLPCLKKNDPTDKANYRRISILPALSKVFEMIVYEQILLFMEPKFDKLLCGFCRGYSTQHTLIFLLNKWHECINNGGIVGTLLMDLSKAYDFIPHDLLIAKLEAYGFSKESLKFFILYISGRKQRVRIGPSVSNWVDILSGVPQGSILGPILFNIFINDIFFFFKDTELCNFADDNTLYACDYSLEKVIFRLQKEATNTIAWFKFNSMVANPDKFQLLLVGLKNTKNQYLKNTTVFASDRVKLLGVTIDKNLNFGEHIKYLCSKANGKCFALSRIRKLKDDPTIKREVSLQGYFRKLKKLKCFEKDFYNKIYPVGSQTARIYTLPKMHKLSKDSSLPSFRPIISTIGTYNYKLAKHLSDLLTPYLPKHFTTFDSFSFVEDLKQVEVTNKFIVSFDVENLFTNIPPNETINIATELFFKDETRSKYFLKLISKNYFKFQRQVLIPYLMENFMIN
ncbi:uncharacterized protein LOC136086327 [Hydra vulgaris]|uniref:Uncharacterized protein LOC136086327 n=1 Tax=Hydra vulgaris TaxID=6087 RepID=A0ABM4CS21_HYDVU